MNTEARNRNILKQKDTDYTRNRGHDYLRSHHHLGQLLPSVLIIPNTKSKDSERPKLLFFNVRSTEYISISYLLHIQDRQNPTPFPIFPAITWPKMTLTFSLVITISSYVVAIDLLTTTLDPLVYFQPCSQYDFKT